MGTLGRDGYGPRVEVIHPFPRRWPNYADRERAGCWRGSLRYRHFGHFAGTNGSVPELPKYGRSHRLVAYRRPSASRRARYERRYAEARRHIGSDDKTLRDCRLRRISPAAETDSSKTRPGVWA